MSLEKIFLLQIDKLSGKKLLLALSGGLDSMVLAQLMLQHQLRFVCAHANFGLRGEESEGDEAFVHTFAQENKVELLVKKFDTKKYKKTAQLSTQEAARELRYAWFEELRQQPGFDLVLTAHHLDDSLETFLINLSRGTGLNGLLGIPQAREGIFRPLADATRAEIAVYAKKNHLNWREDSSNQSDDYLRNRIRHYLLPQLKGLHPTFDNNFLQTLSYLKQTAQVVENEVSRFKNNYFKKDEHGTLIDVNALSLLQPLDWWLHQLFNPKGFTDIKALKNLLTAQSGKRVYSDNFRLVKDRSTLILTPLQNAFSETFFWLDESQTHIEKPIPMVFSTENTPPENPQKKMIFDKDKLNFPLKIRRYQEGDYFYPGGMKGKKKLSKFFKDEKFSLPEKENTWVITSKHQIICIPGKRTDRRFIADENTKNFYVLTVQP